MRIITKLPLFKLFYAALCLSGLFAIFILPILVDTPAPPYINVTRQEYNNALAKWQSRNIKDYEIDTYSYPRLGISQNELTLRVSGNGFRIDIISISGKSTVEDEVLKNNTVEGMFAYVDVQLTRKETLDNEDKVVLPGEMYYRTAFHPELGYPIYLEGHPSNQRIEGVTRTAYDADWKMEVKSVRVIK